MHFFCLLRKEAICLSYMLMLFILLQSNPPAALTATQDPEVLKLQFSPFSYYLCYAVFHFLSSPP